MSSDQPTDAFVYTQPRTIEVHSVRDGDEIATFAGTRELIATLGALTGAESGKGVDWHHVSEISGEYQPKGVDWHPVSGIFGFEGIHTVLTEDGLSWNRLYSYGDVVIRERVQLPASGAETVREPR